MYIIKSEANFYKKNFEAGFLFIVYVCYGFILFNSRISVTVRNNLESTASLLYRGVYSP